MKLFYRQPTWRKNTDQTTEVLPEQNMSFWRSLWQGLQHLLTASGANIVGPTLMGIPASMALFTSGIGTIIYCLITGVPAYMGTSFSFIAPISAVMTHGGGQPVVAGGIIIAALATILLGVIVRFTGFKWILWLMPPAVLSIVVITIGLLLAPTAFSEASSNWVLALITLGLGIIFTVIPRKGKTRKTISALPILLSIGIGYVVALITGQVNTSIIANAPVFTLPIFYAPVFEINFCIQMATISLTAVVMEHIGHLQGTSAIVGQDFMPRTARSLIADGISNLLSWSGTPSVTYGENMGVFAITRVFSVKVVIMAGILATLCGFIGKISPLILSIPSGVIGGATLLLFGMIAWSGFKLIKSNVNVDKTGNQVILAITGSFAVLGVILELNRSNFGGLSAADIAASPVAVANAVKGIQSFDGNFQIGNFSVPGLVAVAIVGITTSLIIRLVRFVSFKLPGGKSDPEQDTEEIF
jgi:NCS2 family nucleobase:cation symporter-2